MERRGIKNTGGIICVKNSIQGGLQKCHGFLAAQTSWISSNAKKKKKKNGGVLKKSKNPAFHCLDVSKRNCC